MLVVAVGRLIPLPWSGSFIQWLYQVIGSNSWAYDDVQVARRRWPATVAWLFSLLVTPAAVAALALRWLPWWLAQVAALAAAAGLLFLLLAGLDRVARDLGWHRAASLPQQVHRLSMVPALSWTPLPSYPGERWRSQRPLLFTSTYNEGGGGYVGGFVENMREGLAGPWGRAPGFPRTADGFRPFIEFVSRTCHPLDHSYIACPTYSVADVRAALHLERGYRSLVAERGNEISRARYNQFLIRHRLSLSSLPAPPGDPLEPWSAEGRRSASTGVTTTILIAVLPFEPGERCLTARRVSGAIHQLDGGFPEGQGIAGHRLSPFNRVGGTHIARLLVVDRWWDPPAVAVRPQIHIEAGDENGALQPRLAWLILAAQLDTVLAAPNSRRSADAGVRQWLADLHGHLGPEPVGAIWGPAAELYNRRRRWLGLRRRRPLNPAEVVDFVELVLSGRSEPLVRVVDHEENTVWDVVRALHTHRAVVRFVLRHPNPAEDALVEFMTALGVKDHH